MNQNQFKLLFDDCKSLLISDHDNIHFNTKPALSLIFSEFVVYMQRYADFFQKF